MNSDLPVDFYSEHINVNISLHMHSLSKLDVKSQRQNILHSLKCYVLNTVERCSRMLPALSWTANRCFKSSLMYLENLSSKNLELQTPDTVKNTEKYKEFYSE